MASAVSRAASPAEKKYVKMYQGDKFEQFFELPLAKQIDVQSEFWFHKLTQFKAEVNKERDILNAGINEPIFSEQMSGALKRMDELAKQRYPLLKSVKKDWHSQKVRNLIQEITALPI